ncbi:MAG: GlxA family transcriptional regulator [Terriglobia bacterium]
MKFRTCVTLFLLFLIASALVPVLRAQPERVRVGILVYDGVYNTEFIAPLDVFTHAATHTGGRLHVFTVSPEFGAVTTAEGLRVLPRYSFATSPPIDWLVVPSGENYKTDVKDKALVAWLRQVGQKAQVVHSNCWGAFLLGAAGLLDGKRATTYPPSLDQFARMFPTVEARRGVDFVDDNGAVTSAGGVTSYSAALYLVEKHWGARVARKVAEGLVIEWDLTREKYEAARSAARP